MQTPPHPYSLFDLSQTAEAAKRRVKRIATNTPRSSFLTGPTYHEVFWGQECSIDSVGTLYGWQTTQQIRDANRILRDTVYTQDVEGFIISSVEDALHLSDFQYTCLDLIDVVDSDSDSDME